MEEIDEYPQYLAGFDAGIQWERKRLLDRIRTTIKDYQGKGLHEMVTALTVLECELEVRSRVQGNS